MREHIAADEPFVREDVAGRATRSSASAHEAPGLQGRADRGSDPRRRRRDRLAVHQRPVHRPVPRPARPVARSGSRRSSCSRSPAPTGAGIRTADAHARVRDGVLLAQGPRGVPRAPRARARRRPPPARPAAGAVQLLRRRRPGVAFWLPAGTQVFNSLVALSREMGATARLHRGQDARSCSTARCGRPRGTGTSTEENMFVTESEDRPMALKPMNCPGHCQLYSMQRALLPGPADALLRARAAAPQRAQRHAARAAACAQLRPGRRATSSAPRSRSRTRSRACLEFAFATYDVFGFDVRLELSTRPEQRIGSDELWDHSEAALSGRSTARGWSTTSTRATAPSTAPRSTCT